MNLGGTVELDEVAATMVDAKHSAAAADETGTHYVGVATGFVLAVADGPVLYHAGDTCVFGDMQLIRELYKPHVAMLPIGGYYTMGPKEAAVACRLLAPEMVLPIHFGTFPPLKGTPEELAALVGAGREGRGLEAGRRVRGVRAGNEGPRTREQGAENAGAQETERQRGGIGSSKVTRRK